jgi:hypothetical protein
MSLFEIGDRGVENGDLHEKERIREKRIDYFCGLEADSMQKIDARKGWIPAVKLYITLKLCLSGFCFHGENEVSVWKCRFNTNTGQTWDF